MPVVQCHVLCHFMIFFFQCIRALFSDYIDYVILAFLSVLIIVILHFWIDANKSKLILNLHNESCSVVFFMTHCVQSYQNERNRNIKYPLLMNTIDKFI